MTKIKYLVLYNMKEKIKEIIISTIIGLLLSTFAIVIFVGLIMLSLSLGVNLFKPIMIGVLLVCSYILGRQIYNEWKK